MDASLLSLILKQREFLCWSKSMFWIIRLSFRLIFGLGTDRTHQVTTSKRSKAESICGLLCTTSMFFSYCNSIGRKGVNEYGKKNEIEVEHQWAYKIGEPWTWRSIWTWKEDYTSWCQKQNSIYYFSSFHVQIDV
jgi:hypothetical protein